MEFDRPNEEAYGRVTKPERYAVVVTAATDLMHKLGRSFDVTETPGTTAKDFPHWRGEPAETTRLRPSAGVPLTFLFTEFPGVLIGFGSWGYEPFPGCGCDACDEPPTEVIERMHTLVQAAIDGQYSEELTKRTLRRSFGGEWGQESRSQRLRHGDRKLYGPAQAHDWPPWPRKQDAGPERVALRT